MKGSAITTIIFTALIMLSFACTQSNKDISETTSTKDIEISPVVDSTIKFKSKGIQAIYNSYVNLRDALVATDIETTKRYAMELKNALEQENKIQEASIVASISNAVEITTARESFYNLNENLGAIFGGNLASGKINKCYCPMARGNQGASWFTTSQEIRNPYFGDKMLKCGSIKETIEVQ